MKSEDGTFIVRKNFCEFGNRRQSNLNMQQTINTVSNSETLSITNVCGVAEMFPENLIIHN
ncbi:MAG: hypothetical protein LBC42_02465 [Puniceicoccales bacterium]|nr:hypothetical protein [Puniceicoccales bacterium]